MASRNEGSNCKGTSRPGICARRVKQSCLIPGKSCVHPRAQTTGLKQGQIFSQAVFFKYRSRQKYLLSLIYSLLLETATRNASIHARTVELKTHVNRRGWYALTQVHFCVTDATKLQICSCFHHRVTHIYANTDQTIMAGKTIKHKCPCKQSRTHVHGNRRKRPPAGVPNTVSTSCMQELCVVCLQTGAKIAELTALDCSISHALVKV